MGDTTQHTAKAFFKDWPVELRSSDPGIHAICEFAEAYQKAENSRLSRQLEEAREALRTLIRAVREECGVEYAECDVDVCRAAREVAGVLASGEGAKP